MSQQVYVFADWAGLEQPTKVGLNKAERQLMAPAFNVKMICPSQGATIFV